MSRPRLSVTKLWISTFCFVRVQRLDDRLGDLDLRREDDADALRALEQLDDDRRAADALDRRHARRRGCARTSWRGMPMLCRDRICVARSLSREFEMPFAVFGV